MPSAGNGRRLLAYTIDIFPIVFVVGAIFFVYFGLGEAYKAYSADIHDPEARAQFLTIRNRARDLSFLAWVIYCIAFEGSSLQGTLGKWLMGIKVVDRRGYPLSFTTSILRNATKLVSILPLGLGFLWVFFNRDNRAWHDLAVGTYVVKR